MLHIILLILFTVFLPFNQVIEFNVSGDTGPIDTVKYITGKFEPRSHPLFTLVPGKYSTYHDQYLRKETLSAFEEMYSAAAKEGINLKIISATRNYNAQKTIWENKWTGKTLAEDGQNLLKTMPDPVARAKKILEYSSMPSTSRHHWGTDVDLNALTNAYFDAGMGKKIYDWLIKNAGRYGFCQPYTAGRPAGYHEERWHWSYIPISRPLMDYCVRKMTNDQVKGFLGAETAASIDVVRNYMLGVSQECWNH